jgi:uncharacterized 2Fe-2S/4Fe-4S cluster protein (DUF4445 family)
MIKVTKYDSFQDGYARGMLVMANNIRELIDYLNMATLTQEEITEELKRTVNDSLKIHLASKEIGITEEVYDVLVNNNKIITTSTKYRLIGNLMSYDD